MDELKNDLTLEPAAEEACCTAETESACACCATAPETAEAPAAEPEAAPISEEQSFTDALEKTLVKIRAGQVLKGTVVQLTESEVCVNIGYKSDGFIPRSELDSDDRSPSDVVKIGDEIEVEVTKVSDKDGIVYLSKKNVDARKAWEAILEKCENGEVIEGVGKEVVKGGLIASVQGIRAFIPASQLSTRYVENVGEFVGKTMRLKAIEVDRGRRRIVASRKQVMIEDAAARKREIWAKLIPGEKISCTVRRITDFGAFADVGGVDGLIHVTDLSWGRVRHPSDVVKPGDVLEVVILSVDQERERISLGYKQLQPHPWEVAPEKYPAGSILEGRVVRIVSFGAFIELEPGLDGLVHISQVAPSRINKVEDVLQVGDIVNVKVLDVDKAAKRISLSIRQAMEEQYSTGGFGEMTGDEYDQQLK